MKYIVILGDGMADEPQEALGGRTPLEAARTPSMDEMAKTAEIGMVKTIPDGMAPGSDTANLAVLGYNPREYYTGRSPLEALSIGVPMTDTDVAMRCNLVTLTEDEPYEQKRIVDHSSGEISTEDAAVLLEAVKKELENETYQFYVGTSYRHCVIKANGAELGSEAYDVQQVRHPDKAAESSPCEESADEQTQQEKRIPHPGSALESLTPPHDHLTEVIGPYLPADETLLAMQKRSYEILKDHPINVERRARGLNPANSCWFWGAGTKPMVDSFEKKNGVRGTMISAVDLLKGIAIGAGMNVVLVEGANGGLDTNYEGKALAAVDALLDGGSDYVYVHLEAPDEMGHQGSLERKIQSIENLDRRIIRIVKEKMDASGEPYRMLVMPDHPTPIRIRTHTADPIPYLLYDSTKNLELRDSAKCLGQENNIRIYCERTAAQSGIYRPEGYRLIDVLLEK
ncbi:MAG: 2,3-bisphosphoglycerate-independent phosphoglycerate mutase [Lachnospiraceae bacterium]|nr:2,3-bisphosphoglycerate-independent phosphoglycerate mutase [Lachnospiraceae bacterium]